MHIGTVVRDQRPDYPGPLAGIEAVAPALTCAVLLVLPCDLPRLSPQVPAQLLAALNEQADVDVVYAETTERQHYLCAAIRTRCLKTVSVSLDQEQRAVWRWYATQSTSTVVFSGAAAEGFVNLNRAADLQR
jgi:molybdopterin-guanine dinucleotide biosynthesis protein A